MTTEEDFQRMLDANPDDHTTRLVFADWLQDRDDERAEGYRALGELRRKPVPCNDSEKAPMPIVHLRRHFYGDEVKVNRESTEYVAEYACCLLPHDWFEKLAPWDIEKGKFRWAWVETRRAAEDAAAFAFAKLPAERRAELLASALVSS